MVWIHHQQRLHHHAQPLPFLLLLVSSLLLLITSTTVAFVVRLPNPSSSICSTSSSMRPWTTTTTTFSRSSVVVSMAKGRKTDKKRKASPPPPAGNKDDDGGKSQQQQQQGEGMASSVKEEEPQSFGILGSDGGSPRRGFGSPSGSAVTPSPSSMDVDDAYEKALSKIKGQDRLAGSPLGNAGAGSGGPPVRADGKVPVRTIGVLDIVPQSVQGTFEVTLIGLLAINLLVIIVIGTGFAVEALPTSNLDLPESLASLPKKIQPFIEKSEALFTPSLGVFFLLSIILGAFKLSQLSRGGTTYVEKSEVEKGLRPNRYQRRNAPKE